MWSLEFIIFFGDNDLVGSDGFFLEIFFIDGGFGEIRFDVI